MRRFLASFLIGLCVGCTSTVPRPTSAEASVQVRAAETGFAKSMADRDFAAFAGFIAEDAVFINGGKPLKGKPEVIGFWKQFFEGPAAPFSWKPEIVEATSTGDLGYTEGPVFSAEGKAFAKFFSTWRRDPSGQWLVVFDNGYTLCECAK